MVVCEKYPLSILLTPNISFRTQCADSVGSTNLIVASPVDLVEPAMSVSSPNNLMTLFYVIHSQCTQMDSI